ncbi:hypothetical protein HPB52_011602 [Rhipicephalus sanguineus]|uniref:CCHC-type domain-containing protein n=1 Tax=Rhipicephalus sanguineus TaxID=34632 RepID=A0A9D4PZI1_RHISA|nr:hypothetical protein HPB52_011602 [Rhipicephalus sanguineus]
MSSSPSVSPFFAAFRPASVPWTQWKRSFLNYLEALGGEELSKKRCRAILLNALGLDGQRVYYSLVPDTTDASSCKDGKEDGTDVFKHALAVQDKHFAATLSGEPIEAYAVALRELAACCYIGDATEKAVRDQLFEGTASQHICSSLTLTRAVEVGKDIEQTQGELKELNTDTAVHQIINKPASADAVMASGSCYRCGWNAHRANAPACPARNARCRKCKKRGHFAAVCRYKNKQKRWDYGEKRESSEATNAVTILTLGIDETPVKWIHVDVSVKEFLQEHRCPRNVYNLLKSFLTNRYVVCKSNLDEVSEQPTLGSPQGSPISPLLWNLVIYGLLDIDWPDQVTVQACADDTVLLIHSLNKTALEQLSHLALAKVSEWSIAARVQALDHVSVLYMVTLRSCYHFTHALVAANASRARFEKRPLKAAISAFAHFCTHLLTGGYFPECYKTPAAVERRGGRLPSVLGGDFTLTVLLPYPWPEAAAGFRSSSLERGSKRHCGGHSYSAVGKLLRMDGHVRATHMILQVHLSRRLWAAEASWTLADICRVVLCTPRIDVSGLLQDIYTLTNIPLLGKSSIERVCELLTLGGLPNTAEPQCLAGALHVVKRLELPKTWGTFQALLGAPGTGSSFPAPSPPRVTLPVSPSVRCSLTESRVCGQGPIMAGRSGSSPAVRWDNLGFICVHFGQLNLDHAKRAFATLPEAMETRDVRLAAVSDPYRPSKRIPALPHGYLVYAVENDPVAAIVTRTPPYDVCPVHVTTNVVAIFSQFALSNELLLLNDAQSLPTFETPYSASWLDLTFATPPVLASGFRWTVTDDNTSEHRLVQVHVGDTPPPGKQRWFSRVSGAAIASSDALDNKIYQRHLRPVRTRPSIKAWFTPELNVERSVVAAKRRHFQRACDLQLHAVFRSHNISALAVYRKHIREARDVHVRGYALSCLHDYLFSKPFKEAFGRLRQFRCLTSLVGPDGTITSTHVESAALLLRTQIAVDDHSTDEQIHLHTRWLASAPCKSTYQDAPVTYSEVVDVLRNTPKKWAPGPDNISPSSGLSPFPALWNVVIDSLLFLRMPRGVVVQAYADDTIILVPAPSRDALGVLASYILRRVIAWSRDVKVSLNCDKTFCVLFSHGIGGMERVHPTVRLGPNEPTLTFKDSLRIPGVIFHRRLTFFHHADYLRNKVAALAARVATFFAMQRSCVRPGHKVLMYRQASAVWWGEKHVDCRLYARIVTTQRFALLALTRAFRTTSTAALQAHAASRAQAIHVYTDGSYTATSAGAAFVVFGLPDRVLGVGRFRLLRATFADSAEVIAFGEALRHVIAAHYSDPGAFYTECLSLLQALASPRNAEPHVLDTRAYHAGMDRSLPLPFRAVRCQLSHEVLALWTTRWRDENCRTELYRWVTDLRSLPPGHSCGALGSRWAYPHKAQTNVSEPVRPYRQTVLQTWEDTDDTSISPRKKYRDASSLPEHSPMALRLPKAERTSHLSISSTNAVSSTGSSHHDLGSDSDSAFSRFSAAGNDIIANISENRDQEANSRSQSPDRSTASVEQMHIPASDRDNEDALSCVSQTTAVLTTSRLDVGTRVQARAREIEEELSRFCLDAGNRIPLHARHFIMARVFELVELCSDLRASAASERGAVLALKDQLAETRRENTALHQRAILAESRSCLLPPLGPLWPVFADVAGGTSAPVLPPGLHEHVTFVTPLAPSTTPARDTLRLIKANIDPVEKDIRDVLLRHTRYGITVFSNTLQTLHNMKRAIEENAVMCHALSMRIPSKRNPHVRFSGVDPDVPPDDFVARLAERNPQLGLALNTCKVKTSLRERSGTQAMIVEVDPQAFARILQQPRLPVGWTSIRAVEDLHVPTCTFCAQYGHGRCSCPLRHDATRAVCTRCGTEGHLGTDCAVRTGDPAVTCAECRRAGLEASGHPTGHPQCPLLVDRVSRLRARTNYGGT